MYGTRIIGHGRFDAVLIPEPVPCTPDSPVDKHDHVGACGGGLPYLFDAAFTVLNARNVKMRH